MDAMFIFISILFCIIPVSQFDYPDQKSFLQNWNAPKKNETQVSALWLFHGSVIGQVNAELSSFIYLRV